MAQMNPAEVQVVAHSVAKGCPPIISIKMRYWRPIHAELMTHRVFTRNASSSRAVPVMKMAETVVDDMFIPKFRKNKPGMQPGAPLNDEEQALAESIWREAAEHCIRAAKFLSDKEYLDIHKQWANRMLEWFGWINVLVTSTEWDNFLRLRLETNEDGTPVPQDEMYFLAQQVKQAIEYSEPRALKPGQWHLPYITPHDRSVYTIEEQKMMSAARCASISYETVDGKEMTSEKARDLGEKLMSRQHWSPFEHQAMADQKIEGTWVHGALHANFKGWAQNRHFIETGSRPAWDFFGL